MPCCGAVAAEPVRRRPPLSIDMFFPTRRFASNPPQAAAAVE